MSLPNWTYVLVGGEPQIWTHNQAYRTWVVATDVPGNVQTSYTVGVSSNGFTYDTQYATSVVTVPVNNNYYNLSTQALPVISGTAVDETFGNRVASVNYSIKESTTSLYWDSNTSTFNSVAEKFLPMTFAPSNVWSSTHPVLVDGRSYQTRMQSTDLAGNLEPLRTATAFTFDISSPDGRVPVAGAERILLVACR